MKIVNIILLIFLPNFLAFAVEPDPHSPEEPINAYRILLRLHPGEGGSALKAPSRISKVSARISDAFLASGYLISEEPTHLGDKAGERISHLLEASVGAMQVKTTPKGISLSLGNSNPRSMEFNKADVLPVTCVLREEPGHREVARLSEDKRAPDPLDLSVLDPTEREVKTVSFLANSIGATCHKLVSELGVVPTVSGHGKGTAKALRDSVEIEVSDQQATSTPPTADHASAQIPSRQPVAQSTQTKDADSKPAIKTETSPATSWLKKQVQVSNQGDTVILKFGVDR